MIYKYLYLQSYFVHGNEPRIIRTSTYSTD